MLTKSITPTCIAGIHTLAEESDELLRGAREKVRAFINAPASRAGASRRHTEQIIFTSGTTHAINLVARSWGDANLRRRRRNPADRNGAPLEPRALASIGRADRGRGAAYPA